MTVALFFIIDWLTVSKQKAPTSTSQRLFIYINNKGPFTDGFVLNPL